MQQFRLLTDAHRIFRDAESHPAQRRMVVRAALMCFMAFALAACTSASTSSSMPTYRNGSGTDYARYQTMAADRVFLNGALEELTRRCMVAAGFQYWPVPSLPQQYNNPARPLTVEQALNSGYRALDPPVEAPGSVERDKYLSGLSGAEADRYQYVLTGPGDEVVNLNTPVGKLAYPAEGCSTASLKQLFDEPGKYVTLDAEMRALTALPEYRPDLDPALTKADSTWAQCMSAAGYRYARPALAIQAATAADAAGSASSNGAVRLPSQPSPPALSIAVSDAKCRQQTLWDAANALAVRNALAVVVEAHQSDVLTYNEIAAAGTMRAKTLLSQG